MKLTLQEVDYKNIHKILNDTSIYNDLAIDNANYIISKISDALYTLNTRLETLGQIANHTKLFETQRNIDKITDIISSTFETELWKSIIEDFENLD